MENAINEPSIAIEHSHANNDYSASNETSDRFADGSASELCADDCHADDGGEATRPTGTIVHDGHVATTRDDGPGPAMAIAQHDDAKPKHIRKKAFFLHPPSDEMMSADIAATADDIRRLKHVQVRSKSTSKLYQSSRRVSFPENDSELVTGCLEPADPWACG